MEKILFTLTHVIKGGLNNVHILFDVFIDKRKIKIRRRVYCIFLNGKKGKCLKIATIKQRDFVVGENVVKWCEYMVKLNRGNCYRHR